MQEETEVLTSCKPLGDKIFVELLPVEISKLLAAATIEYTGTHVRSKKHFDYPVRYGKVLSVGAKVRELHVNDIVVFRGDIGKWVLSDDFRSLREGDVLCLEERTAA